MVRGPQSWLAPAPCRMARCSWAYGDRERQATGKSDRGRLRRLVGDEVGCHLPGGRGLVETLLDGSKLSYGVGDAGHRANELHHGVSVVLLAANSCGGKDPRDGPQWVAGRARRR